VIAAFLLSSVVANAAVDNKPSELTIARIEARLFYEETGRLSDELLHRSKPFSGWNTIIGEGDAEEHADDLLVTVRMEPSGGAAQDQKSVDAPLTLSAYDRRGKLIGQRTYDHLLTSDVGRVSKPLWLPSVGCIGDLRIVAGYNGEQKSAVLTLGCGE
jgi:hypothetical protein